MTCEDVFGRLLARAAAGLPGFDIVGAEEAEEWEPGCLEAFLSLSLLRPAAPRQSILCPVCDEGHEVEVVFLPGPAGSPPRAYVSCPTYGMAAVDPAAQRQWRLDPSGFAGYLATALTLSQPSLLAPNLWHLGPLAGEDQHRDVLLLLSNAPPPENLLLTTSRPILLVASQREGSPTLPRVDLRRIVAIGHDGPRLDVQYLQSVLASAEGRPPESLFRREGDVWRLRFRGKPSTVKHRVGLSYILELLRRRGQKIPALTLYYAVHGTPAGAASLFTQPEPRPADDVTPDRARSEACLTFEQTRAIAISEELRAAQEAQDEEREEELLGELETIHDLVAKRERDTKAEPDPAFENARSNVRQNIKRAYLAIAHQDEALASYLEHAITTGHSCSYDPTDPVPWEY